MTRGSTASLDRFYPPYVWDMPVDPAFPVPRKVHSKPLAMLMTPRAMYGQQAFVQTFDSRLGPDELSILDKNVPSSPLDLLILASDEERVLSSISDVSPDFAAAVVEVGRAFVGRFLEQSSGGHVDGVCTLSFNYDPSTVDRPNGQFWDKRFHAHCNFWPRSDVTRLAPVRFSSLDRLTRWRMIDPLADLGADVLISFAREFHPGLALRKFGGSGHAPAAGWTFPSWNELDSYGLSESLRELHHAAVGCDAVLRDAFLLPGLSRTLRDRDVIQRGLHRLDWLSPQDLTRLLDLASTLRPAPDGWGTTHPDEFIRVALAGLDYNVTLSGGEADGADSLAPRPPSVALTPKFFSDIGGSPAMGRAPVVRLERWAGPVLSTEEQGARRAFLQDFCKQLEPRLANLGFSPRD